MTSLPTFPTDSLYKFIALFGIVLLGFGLWYPEHKFRAGNAPLRENYKAERLRRISIDRKESHLKKTLEKLHAKTAELGDTSQTLEGQHRELEAKTQTLKEDATRAEKGGRHGSEKELKDRQASLAVETATFLAKFKEHNEAIAAHTLELKAVMPLQEEVSDELRALTVIMESSIEESKSFRMQAENWLLMQNFSCIAGSILILVGFTLWYFKVQRYQDRILRKQAAG